MSGAKLRAVVIGASSGALEALSIILPALPQDYPLAILVVVHIPPDKDSLLATILGAKCRMKVHEAEDKEPVEPGNIYIAPPGYHLLVEQDATLSLSNEEEIHYSRPSIDVLFEAAADAYGEELIGVILSGANDDGAAGLQAVAEAGGIAIVQKPAEAFSPEMPQAALAMCPTANVLTLAMIVNYLNSISGTNDDF